MAKLSEAVKDIKEAEKEEKELEHSSWKEFRDLRLTLELVQKAEQSQKAGHAKEVKRILKKLYRKFYNGFFRAPGRDEVYTARAYNKMRITLDRIIVWLKDINPKWAEEMARLEQQSLIYERKLMKFAARYSGDIKADIAAAKKNPALIQKIENDIKNAIETDRVFDAVIRNIEKDTKEIDAFLKKIGKH